LFSYTFGVIGNDKVGNLLLSLLEEGNISTDGIIIDSERPTTSKLRVLSNGHQLLRIDSEKIENIRNTIEEKIKIKIEKHIIDSEAIIFEDYNKGFLTEKIIRDVIKLASHSNKLVTVDPKINFLESYKNCTLFKPNKNEAEQISGIKINNERALLQSAKKIFDRINPKYLLITLAEDGMVLFDARLIPKYFAAKARKIADVSGAGDTVISIITAALVHKYKIDEAVKLANTGAGIVVEKRGVVPIKPEEIDFGYK